MRNQAQQTRSRLAASLAAGVTIAAVVATWWASAGERASTAPAAADAGAPTSAGAAGLVIHRDPVTGELGVPPPGAMPPPLVAAPGEALRTPGALRAEEPGPSVGGGWKLGQGPVLQTMSATMGPDGRVRIDCLPGAKE